MTNPQGVARTRRAVIQPLAPADIAGLNLDYHPRLQEGEAEALVVQLPGLSQWVPEAGEFALVVPWRHRAELPWVHTLWGFSHEAELLAAVVDAAREQGRAGVILMDAHESRPPSFFARNNMELLETIVTYELPDPDRFLATLHEHSQRFVQVDYRRPELLGALLEVDHAAFPWLWWNSEAEFTSYLTMPNVEIWAGVLDGQMVTYLGITHFRGWSHLDRIAVRPDVQGHGLGREALHFAVQRMVGRGARRVGLSTQGENARSRRLYESVGFQETPAHHYEVHGVLFAPGRRQVAEGG